MRLVLCYASSVTQSSPARDERRGCVNRIGVQLSNEISTPYGYCQCGCGRKVTISEWSNTLRGWTKGKPRKFCHGHGTRKRLEDRYKVEDRGYQTPCWVWRVGFSDDGYGRIWHDGTTTSAHRFFYTQSRGEIPAGLHLDHLCRVRACVNPEHLEPVTPSENIRRGHAARKRA